MGKTGHGSSVIDHVNAAQAGLAFKLCVGLVATCQPLPASEQLLLSNIFTNTTRRACQAKANQWVNKPPITTASV